jgi:hypothetical protein
VATARALPGYRGEATIIQEDRHAAVTGQYEVMQAYPAGPDGPGGLLSWSGSYAGADLVVEPEPGHATLRLSDGRQGEILITSAYGGAGQGIFKGNGDPP